MKNFFENITIKKNDGIVITYILTGLKGAKYYLVRNIHDHFLYSDRKIKGCDRFTDKNGYLEPVYRRG